MTLGMRPLDDLNALAPPSGGVALAWLGQAGFLIAGAGKRIVIDAYLSDSLAEKYRGKAFPHERMMAIPIMPGNLRGIDWLFCTHGHTDHMDPGTIPELLAANPHCRVLAPRAERSRAIERGVPADRLTLINAGDTLELGGVTVTATAAAHETIEWDETGNFKFLGYQIQLGGVSLWHSGDTIPFDGIGAELSGPIDLALLPINGRDAARAANGVPGNLTLSEALEVAEAVGADALICHHFGLFQFNTADPEEVQAVLDKKGCRTMACLAQMGVAFEVRGAIVSADANGGED